MGDLISFPRSLWPGRAPEPPADEKPLWREAVGRTLREWRQAQRRTLADVAEEAGVSTQYLSEIERGLKDPSSEILAAVIGALRLQLVDLTGGVTRQLTPRRPHGPVALAV